MLAAEFMCLKFKDKALAQDRNVEIISIQMILKDKRLDEITQRISIEKNGSIGGGGPSSHQHTVVGAIGKYPVFGPIGKYQKRRPRREEHEKEEKLKKKKNDVQGAKNVSQG